MTYDYQAGILTTASCILGKDCLATYPHFCPFALEVSSIHENVLSQEDVVLNLSCTVRYSTVPCGV